MASIKLREFSYCLGNYSPFNVSQYRDYATGCTLEEARFDSRQQEEIFLFSKLSRQVLEYVQSPTPGIAAKFFQG